MKQTPSGQPVWLMNVVHTNCEDALGEDRIRMARNEPKKTEMQRKTVLCKSKDQADESKIHSQCEGRLTSNEMRNWKLFKGQYIIQ